MIMSLVLFVYTRWPELVQYDFYSEYYHCLFQAQYQYTTATIFWIWWIITFQLLAHIKWNQIASTSRRQIKILYFFHGKKRYDISILILFYSWRTSVASNNSISGYEAYNFSPNHRYINMLLVCRLSNVMILWDYNTTYDTDNAH